MSADEAQELFIKECLIAHNKYRQMHDVAPLRHNQKLSRIALQWAKKIATNNKLEHSGAKLDGENLGENLAMWFTKGADRFNGQDATDQWYEEISNFNFRKPGFSASTGHFTQLVWNGTREVGFGVAIAPNGYFYAVANYYPVGNVIGEFDRNVFPVVVTQQPSKRRLTKEEDIDDDRDEDIREIRRKPSKQIPTRQREELTEIEESRVCC